MASGGVPPTPCTRTSVTPSHTAASGSWTLARAMECLGMGIAASAPEPETLSMPSPEAGPALLIQLAAQVIQPAARWYS